MKKLVLMLAVVFSASLFSCNNSKEEATATDTIEVAAEVDTLVVADSAATDTVVATTVAVAE